MMFILTQLKARRRRRNCSLYPWAKVETTQGSRVEADQLLSYCSEKQPMTSPETSVPRLLEARGAGVVGVKGQRLPGGQVVRGPKVLA